MEYLSQYTSVQEPFDGLLISVILGHIMDVASGGARG